ncbi:MAG: PAS domain S-box protein [Micropepsaceae bacterium]
MSKPPPETDVSASKSVTAAEIIRNFGHWQHLALEEPLAITHHGRARVMLISADTYERLATRRQPHAAEPIELLQFVENCYEGFLAYDADLRLTYMNRVAENYFGRSKADWLGKHVDDGSQGPINPFIRSMMERVLKTGEASEYEAESKIFPGRRLSLRTFPYRGGVATLFQNHTERERLRTLGETARAMRLAVQQTGQTAVVKLDARGWMDTVDPVFTQMTGFEATDLKGIRLINCVVPQDRRHVQQFFDEVGAQMKSGVFTARVIVKNGEERRFNIAVAPVLYDYNPRGLLLLLSRADEAKDA